MTERARSTTTAVAGTDEVGVLGAGDPDGPATSDTASAATADAGAADAVAGSPTESGEVDRLERGFQRVILAVSLAPLLVAAVMLVFGVGGSYLPSSDHALTELGVRDVGRHEVVVGLYSRADWSHPGPALFYLLAPFYWLTGGESIGMNLGALAINGAAIAGMLAVARRHGGTGLMATTALGCALLLRATGAEFAHDPWNCFVTVLPFGLTILLTWSMACGSRWALPLGAGVATCIAQAHVGFIALALPLVAVGALGLAVRSWRDTPAGEGGLGDRARRTGLVAPAIVTGAVLALLWAPTVADVLLNSPSNIGKILGWFRDAEGGTQSISSAVRTISGQFGAEAEWLGGKAMPSIGGESAFLYHAPLPWLLVPVAASWVVLWRWGGAGRRLVATLAATLVLSVLAVVRTVGPAFDYRLRWTWMVAALVSAVAAWAGIRAVGHRSEALGRGLVGAVGVALVVLGVVNVTTATRAGTPEEGDSAALDAVMPGVLEEVEGADGPVLVTDVYATGTWYGRGIVLQLERRGIDARVPPEQGQVFGQRRVLDGEPAVTLVVATDEYVEDVRNMSPSLRQIADWSGVSAEEQAAADREQARLDEALAAGQLTPGAHTLESWALDVELASATGATARRVTVFVDDG